MILVINSGSATLKFSVFDKKLKKIFSGIVERIGLLDSFFAFGEEKVFYKKGIQNHELAFKIVLEKISEKGFEINLVGHRVVHGGVEFTKPTLITPKVLKSLEKYNKLAPLHNPVNISCIKASMKLLPKIKNFAVFDTSFHSTIPDYAYNYALPYELCQKNHIRRYGFHGISHQYVCLKAAEKLKKPLSELNLISCHLGSGASITAVKNGKSVDTSMGFTPLEGLIMSTRSGDLDSAIIFYLNKELGLTFPEIEEMLNYKSGILGISGFKDMRDVLVRAGFKVEDFLEVKATKEEKERCELALKMFVYRIVKYVGAYFAVLGKVDAIIFTGGIGERNLDIREKILHGLKGLGKIRHFVIETNEELMIAKEITLK